MRFLVLFAFLPFTVPASASPPSDTDVVSTGLAGMPGNDASEESAISAAGRFVAFSSVATNLVANDTNGRQDVFLRDRLTGVTTRVSVSSGGTQANGASSRPSMSADGRFIAFQSTASNLVANDTNGESDVFLHDRVTGFTTRVSVTSAGLQANDASGAPAISGNGQIVAFESTASNLYFVGNDGQSQVYAHDTSTGGTYLCSRVVFVPGNGGSYEPDVSYDGERIVFRSHATNLQAGGNPFGGDIFLFDGGTVSLVSRGLGGGDPDGSSWQPAISGDGNSVAFRSDASNLIAGGTLGEFQVFLYDITSDTTTIVSRSTSGSHGDDQSAGPSISYDGKRVAFWSDADNLVLSETSGGLNVFVRDVTTATTACLTRSPDGQPGQGDAGALSADGNHVAFSSFHDHVPGYSGSIDVYVRRYGVLSRNAGSNPLSYTASRPALGESWRARVDLTTTGHAFAAVFGMGSLADIPLGGGQRLLAFGEIAFTLPLQPGPVATWTSLVPLDPVLAGVTLHSQAVHLGGVTPFALSNARDLCLAY